MATLEMSTLLLKQLVYVDTHCFLQDRHLAAVEGAREESTLLLRNFYKVWEKVHVLTFFLLLPHSLPMRSPTHTPTHLPPRAYSIMAGRTIGEDQEHRDFT